MPCVAPNAEQSTLHAGWDELDRLREPETARVPAAASEHGGEREEELVDRAG